MSSKNLLEDAMNYLSERRCSEYVLQDYLEKSYVTLDAPSIIKKTMKRLHQLDLINDDHIALQIAERFSHKGDAFIESQLQEAGIKKENRESALQSIGSEYERALFQAQLKIKENSSNQNNTEVETMIMRFLSSRHFSFITVKKVIDRLLHTKVLKILK